MTAFTSDLSLDEALCIGEIGFEPVELVVASANYHIGIQWGAWSQNQELDQITAALAAARISAMGRLVALTQQAGGDGIVGVRLTFQHHGHHALFSAMGTAVRRTDGTSAAWRVGGRPFTSALSGQDLFALVKGGFKPRGLVVGNCVYHIAHQSLKQWFSTTAYQNVEMANFTSAMYEARELAMDRLQREATAVGATGVVGMTITEGSYQWESHVIEFLAEGTAVAPLEGTHAPTVKPVLEIGTG